MKLYHYTSLESFSKIWMSHSLLFAESKGTNDVFESQKFLSIDHCKIPYNGEETELEAQGHFNKMFWAEVNKYKQISLIQDYKDGTMGYASPMMWGHYAQKGKGVCIELESEKINFPENGCAHKAVEYTKEVPIINLTDGVDLHTEELIRDYIRNNIDTIFFKKHRHWEHENEYRVISDTEVALDIKDAIANVYLPYNEEDIEFQIVEKLVEGSNVDLSMILTYGSSYRRISAISIRKLKECREFNKRRKNIDI